MPFSDLSTPREFRTDTLVIGAGQAGLAAAYYLRQAGAKCILVEQAAAVGQVWAMRYDSLRLFSPAWASGLPGFAWPGNQLRYPTKDEAADYLRQYAAHFGFEVHTGQRVVHLGAIGENGFEAHTQDGARYVARRVIVSTGSYEAPRLPEWAAQLAPEVQQLHSHAYRNPAQLPGTGPVAVVGSGNSALQIAADLAETGRPVYAAFDSRTPAMANNTLTWALLRGLRIFRASRHGHLGAWMRAQPEPVVAADLQRLRRFPNVHWIGRAHSASGATLVGGADNTPSLQAVVWATGYRPGFNWINLPVLDEAGWPRHHRGLSEQPGLAFLGLPWLDNRGSALMGGVAHDARRLVKQLLVNESAHILKKGNRA